MNFLYERITYLFDPLHHLWEHEKMHRKISVLLVMFFLGSLIGIELKRQAISQPPSPGISPAIISMPCRLPSPWC